MQNNYTYYLWYKPGIHTAGSIFIRMHGCHVLSLNRATTKTDVPQATAPSSMPTTVQHAQPAPPVDRWYLPTLQTGKLANAHASNMLQFSREHPEAMDPMIVILEVVKEKNVTLLSLFRQLDKDQSGEYLTTRCDNDGHMGDGLC